MLKGQSTSRLRAQTGIKSVISMSPFTDVEWTKQPSDLCTSKMLVCLSTQSKATLSCSFHKRAEPQQSLMPPKVPLRRFNTAGITMELRVLIMLLEMGAKWLQWRELFVTLPISISEHYFPDNDYLDSPHPCFDGQFIGVICTTFLHILNNFFTVSLVPFFAVLFQVLFIVLIVFRPLATGNPLG
eukprot:m.345501 g.345501  ORF g.345501 m.345501 type:complete len:185 (-) comp16558_c0_seq5:1811-2365(-)